LKNCKSIVELDLCANPISNFAGLKSLQQLDYLNISQNKNVRNLKLIPFLPSLSKLTAEHCALENLKTVTSKFPDLNIGNFKHNVLREFQDIEEITKIDYLAELDIRENPLSQVPAIKETILAEIPDLEVFNEEELLEPGFRFKVQNEEIKKYLEDTEENEEK
jgi:Leucine-rich repeat (LRR) protein